MKKLDKAYLAERIEKRAAQDLAECNIGGASILVAQDDKILYRNHFGTVAPGGEKVSENTCFRLASMTKPITAVATMILVERGLLSLEDPIDRFYPAFASMEVRESADKRFVTDKKITIKNLLTHSSGIGSGEAWTDSVPKLKEQNRDTVEHFIEFLSHEPLSFVPDTKQEYSGVGAFSVLTGIIQKVSGMSYEDFLKKELFIPCKMERTTFVPTETQWRDLITMHHKREGKNAVGKTWDGCVFDQFPAENYLGGAGLISCLEDYYHFAQMLLHRGEYEGVRVLSEASIDALSRPQFFKRTEEWWGLGVRVITHESYDSLPVGTFGWSGAYGTHFWVDPRNQIIGIYMKNSHYDGGSGALTSKNFERDVYC